MCFLFVFACFCDLDRILVRCNVTTDVSDITRTLLSVLVKFRNDPCTVELLAIHAAILVALAAHGLATWLLRDNIVSRRRQGAITALIDGLGRRRARRRANEAAAAKRSREATVARDLEPAAVDQLREADADLADREDQLRKTRARIQSERSAQETILRSFREPS